MPLDEYSNFFPGVVGLIGRGWPFDHPLFFFKHRQNTQRSRAAATADCGVVVTVGVGSSG